MVARVHFVCMPFPQAAMNQLTKNLACEWAKDGIRTAAVAPWYTATDLALQARGDTSAEMCVHHVHGLRDGENEQSCIDIVRLCCTP